jgi:hypothetical protein
MRELQRTAGLLLAGYAFCFALKQKKSTSLATDAFEYRLKKIIFSFLLQ